MPLPSYGTGGQLHYVTGDTQWITWNKAWTTTTSNTVLFNDWFVQDNTYAYQPLTWTTTATYAEDVYWGGWNNTFVSNQAQQRIMRQDHYGQWNEYERQRPLPEETAEQRAEREARQAERAARAAEAAAVRQAEAAKRHEEKVAADSRARELLLANLDAQQKRDLLEHRWFEVISNNGRRWRIRTGDVMGNVDLMPEEGNERLASYCAHPPGVEALPTDDHHIAQKLVLEAEEERFLDVAYLHYRSRDVRPEALPGRRRVA